MKNKNQHGLDRRSFLSIFPKIALTPLLISPMGNAIASDIKHNDVIGAAGKLRGIRYLSPLDENTDTENHVCMAAPVMPVEGAGYLHTMTVQGIVGSGMESLGYVNIKLSHAISQSEHTVWTYDQPVGESSAVSFTVNTADGGVDLFLDAQRNGGDSYDRYRLAFRQSRLSMAPALRAGDYFIPLAMGMGPLFSELVVSSERFLLPTSEEQWERRVTDINNASQPYLLINVKSHA